MLRSITEASSALALAEVPRVLFGCWEVRSAICPSGGKERNHSLLPVSLATVGYEPAAIREAAARQLFQIWQEVEKKDDCEDGCDVGERKRVRFPRKAEAGRFVAETEKSQKLRPFNGTMSSKAMSGIMSKKLCTCCSSHVIFRAVTA
jgi:hypothetical protein